MASMVEDRVEVGKSDMGNVFIFHFTELEDYRDVARSHRYEVRAGNHTVLTTSDRAEADTVAAALCRNVAVAAEAVTASAPLVEEEAAPEEPKKVSKK